MSGRPTATPSDDLVLGHLRLVDEIVRRHRNKGVPLEDLQQVAAVGLVLAAHRYDPSRGVPFAAFAVPTMNGEVRRYFRDHGWAVRPPRSVQELAATIRSRRARLEQELGRAPSAADLALDVGKDEPAVQRALQALGAYSIVSLDASVGGGESPTLPDHDPALLHEASLELVDDIATRIDLRRAILQLSERDRRFLHLRYVDELSQAQVARRMSVSQVQVSRLLQRIHAALHAILEEAAPPAQAPADEARDGEEARRGASATGVA